MMQLRTSFCNGTVLKKDLTRFSPVWGLYTVFLLLVFLTQGMANPDWSAVQVTATTDNMAVVNLIYASICANVLFGDLFSPRMCNALHAMPLRREGWFFTHVLAGLLFCLIPTVLVAALLGVILRGFFYIALLWLAVMALEFLFFFGIGTVSAMCAGNRLGLTAVYLILNLFSGLVYMVVDQLYEPLLYGMDFDSTIYKVLCPVFYLTDSNLIRFDFSIQKGTGVFMGIYPTAWLYLGAVAVIGLVLLVLAVILYRKRNLERAGDLVTWNPLKPVFQVIFTLACGVFMYVLKELFGYNTSFTLVVIGMVVGFFVGRMLMERTVRVFRWKNFLALGIFAVVFAASLLITKLDPLGLTWYVPEGEDVEFARIYEDDDSSIYGDPRVRCLQAETPEDIEKLRQLHATLITENYDKSDGVSQVEILYQLKDGKTVRRYYSIDERTQVYDELRVHFSNWEYLFNTSDWESFAAGVENIDISLGDLFGDDSYGAYNISDPEQIAALMAAVKADCDAGTMAQEETFHVGEDYGGWLYLEYDLQTVLRTEGEMADTGAPFRHVSVYTCNTNTVACLKEILAEMPM